MLLWKPKTLTLQNLKRSIEPHPPKGTTYRTKNIRTKAPGLLPSLLVKTVEESTRIGHTNKYLFYFCQQW